MHAILFLVLVVVYVLGVAGVVGIGTLLGTGPDELGSLDERLELARTCTPPIPRHHEPAP
jgi:hypothetical protein